MNLPSFPPRINYFGDLEKAHALKGLALNFWQQVTHPMATGLKTNTVSRRLRDGVILTAQYYTMALGQKVGRVSVFVPVLTEGGEDVVYIVYSDWKGARNSNINVDRGYLDKFIHQKSKLLTSENDIPQTHRSLPIPRFDPKIGHDFRTTRQSTYTIDIAVGNISRPIYTRVIGNKHWTSAKNERSLNWDRHSVYKKGTDFLEIYLDNIVTCCMPDKDTVILINGFESYDIKIYRQINKIWSLSATLPFSISSGARASLVGFKTDAINLIVLVTSSKHGAVDSTVDSSQNGLYRYEFSADYTTFTDIKISDSIFASINSVSAYSDTRPAPSESNEGTVSSTTTETLSNATFQIVDIFYNKDAFTCIVFKIDSFSHNYSFNYEGSDSITASFGQRFLIDDDFNLIGGFWAYKIDFATDTVIDLNKKVYSLTSHTTENSHFEVQFGAVVVNRKTINTTSESLSCLIYADYKTDVYAFRKNINTISDEINSGVRTVNQTILTDVTLTAPLFEQNILHDTYSLNDITGSFNPDIPWTFQEMFNLSFSSSLSSSYEKDFYLYNLSRDTFWGASYEYSYENKHSFAFDGILLAFSTEAFVLHDSRQPTSIIFNVESHEIQFLDYMIDFPENSFNDPFAPISITKL